MDDKSNVKQELSDAMVMDDIDVKAPGMEAFADVFARFQLPPDEATVRASFYFRISSFLPNII